MLSVTPAAVRRATTLGVVVLVAACSLRRGRASAGPDLAEARRALIAADAGRGDTMATRGFAALAAAAFTDDVVYLAPGAPPLIGRPAAAVALDPRRAGGRDARWSALGAGVSADGRSGWTYGVRAAVADSGGRALLDRYIAFWRRGGDGRWRIAAYSEIGTPPVTGHDGHVGAVRSPDRGERLNRVSVALRETDAAFSLLADRRGTPAAFAEYAAEEGILFAGTELVVGPRAIRESLERNRSGATLSWNPIYADVAESGDLGFTVGEYVVTGRTPSGAVAQQMGKYLTVWRRQPNGKWRYVADGGSPSPSGRAP